MTKHLADAVTFILLLSWQHCVYITPECLLSHAQNGRQSANAVCFEYRPSQLLKALSHASAAAVVQSILIWSHSVVPSFFAIGRPLSQIYR